MLRGLRVQGCFEEDWNAAYEGWLWGYTRIPVETEETRNLDQGF